MTMPAPFPAWTQDKKKMHLSMMGAHTLCGERVWHTALAGANVTCTKCLTRNKKLANKWAKR